MCQQVHQDMFTEELSRYYNIASLSQTPAVYAYQNLDGCLDFRYTTIEDCKVYVIKTPDNYTVSVYIPVTIESLNYYLNSEDIVNSQQVVNKRLYLKALAIKEYISNSIKDMKDIKKTVYTGYSIGAGVSAILACLEKDRGFRNDIFNLAQPPVFNKEFYKAHNTIIDNYTNWKNTHDYVVRYNQKKYNYSGESVHIGKSIQAISVLEELYYHDLIHYRV